MNILHRSLGIVQRLNLTCNQTAESLEFSLERTEMLLSMFSRLEINHLELAQLTISLQNLKAYCSDLVDSLDGIKVSNIQFGSPQCTSTPSRDRLKFTRTGFLGRGPGRDKKRVARLFRTWEESL